MCTCWEWIDQCTSSSLSFFFFRRLSCCFFTLWSKGHRARRQEERREENEEGQFQWHKKGKLWTTWQTSSYFSSSLSVIVTHTLDRDEFELRRRRRRRRRLRNQCCSDRVTWWKLLSRREGQSAQWPVSSDTSRRCHVARGRFNWLLSGLATQALSASSCFFVFFAQHTTTRWAVSRARWVATLANWKSSEWDLRSRRERKRTAFTRSITARAQTHTFMERLTCNCNFFLSSPLLFPSLYCSRMVLVHLQTLLLNIICLMRGLGERENALVPCFSLFTLVNV